MTVWIGLLAFASAGADSASAAPREGRVKITTDGHLRVGHRETIRVSGFPGKGNVEVSFFPTAICEDGCSARNVPAGRTDAHGAGTFRVRVPGTFMNEHERPTYYRDGERIDVEVTWEGADRSFDVGSAEPEPVIVRAHGGRKSARAAPRSSGAPRAAAPTGPAPRAPLPIPYAFELPAGHGYTLDAFAKVPGSGSTDGALVLVVYAKGRRVTYEAPATVTETSIAANLGELGQVAIEFQRSHKAATVSCEKQKVQYESGSWVGTIQFHGEEGYAVVEATSVPGSLEFLRGELCAPSFTSGSSGPRKGAELFVRNPGLGPQLSVYKHRPGSAALIDARLNEYIGGSGSGPNGGISIERAVAAWMPGSDFSYDPRLRTATVTPPPGPFAGSARFDLGVKAGRRWSGDLTVDMPGRAAVPLTGPLLRGSLSPSE
jgi:hypothetical protein